MSTGIDRYLQLIDAFLGDRLQPAEFRTQYLATFQAQQGWLKDDEFKVLDGLFADVDAFEPDAEIRRELLEAHPESYLDEAGLRTAVERAKRSLTGN